MWPATLRKTLPTGGRHVPSRKLSELANPHQLLAWGQRQQGMTRRTRHWLLAAAAMPITTVPINAALNKNACVTFAPASARRIQLTPPGSTRSLSIALPQYPSPEYCGPADPGHAVDVIPVQPRLTDVFFELKG